MAYQERQQDQAVSQQMFETGASVASHLLEAERIATALQGSARWRDGVAAITVEHNKAMQAVLGSATATAATRSALANISHHTESLAAAKAVMRPNAAAALAAAVKHNDDIKKAVGSVTAAIATRSALANISGHAESLAAAKAVMRPNAAAALAAAVKHNIDIPKVLGGTTAAAQSVLTDVSLKTSSLAALGATLDPGVGRLAKTLHGQFSGITDTLKAHRIHPAVLPHEQLSATMRQLSMKPDLGDVAASAASLIQSVGLSKVLTSDIQHMARAADQADLVADFKSPRDHELPSPDSALHEIVEPSLDEADFSLLLILVVLAVFPALLATSMAHVTQTAQDLLFMLRVVGKLTQLDDAIPGALLLNAIIRSIRRPRGR